MTVFVFGGRGFVGSAICKEAQKRGVKALAVSRTSNVPCDALRKDQLEKVLSDRINKTTNSNNNNNNAVVISIGSPPLPFVDYKKQFEWNGLSNKNILECCERHHITNIVLINATMPTWIAKGYRDGKLLAESEAHAFAKRNTNCRVLILKPSVINGSRKVFGSIHIPLWLVLSPLSYLMNIFKPAMEIVSKKFPFLNGLLFPPVHVEKLAHAALDLIEGEENNKKGFPQGVTVMDPYDILSYQKNI